MTVAVANVSGTRWTCSLSRPDGYTAFVIWDTAGDATYTPTGPWVQYRAIDGQVVPWTSGAVTIGIKPVMFESAAGVVFSGGRL